MFLMIWFSRSLVDTGNFMTSVERVLNYLKIEPEAAETTSTALAVTEGKVEFKNVTMRYRPHLDPSLKELSFLIPAKSKVGIVGRTAAGKSSILTTIFRMNEIEEGQILIDNTDISQVGLRDLRL
jgi:ABC-type multidrug transport system fused ATPase/permease subunit